MELRRAFCSVIGADWYSNNAASAPVLCMSIPHTRRNYRLHTSPWGYNDSSLYVVFETAECPCEKFCDTLYFGFN